jgi:uncharacterized protein YrrD
MLRSLNEITGYSLQATDGDIGCCEDFIFDDQSWVVRYMLADTNAWLPGSKKTLISPVSLGEPDWKTTQLSITLTKKLIKNSTERDEHKQVSREYEARFFDYYNYDYYWMGAGLWGSYPAPTTLANTIPKASITDDEELNKVESIDDGQLRSAKEVEGYTIKSIDGEIGHVEDFILNDEDWTIAYLVVNTASWLLLSRKVLIAPSWLASVSWIKRSVCINLTSAQIKKSPEYDTTKLIDTDNEDIVHNFYQKLKEKI